MDRTIDGKEINNNTRQSSDTLDELIFKGNQFFNEYKSDKALQCFDKALEINPNSAEALYGKGIATGKSGRPQIGLEYLEKAFALSPDKAIIPFTAGTYHFLLREPEKAIEYYEKAIDLSPDYSDAWFNMGIAYGALKRPEKALLCITKAMELSGTSAEALYNIGNAYYMAEQYEEAAEYLKNAAELAPDDYQINYKLFDSHKKIGEHRAALKYMEKVCSLEPDNLLHRFELAKLNFSTYNTEKAIIQLKELKDIAPELPEIDSYLGYSLIIMKKYDEAIPVLENALKADSGNYMILTILAETCCKTGRYEDAIEKAKLAMQSNPGSWGPYALIAMGYTGLFKYDRALKWIDKGLKKGDNKAEAYYHKAIVHYKKHLYSADKNKEISVENSENIKKVFECLKNAALSDEKMYDKIKYEYIGEFEGLMDTELFMDFIANL